MIRFAKNHRIAADLCLIGFLLALSAVLYFLFAFGGEAGGTAVVRINGEEAARYPLDTDGVYKLNGGTNTLVIENGQAWISEADCPDKLCVKQGRIQYTGQCITCLPNKLTVTVEGGEDDGVDIVS